MMTLERNGWNGQIWGIPTYLVILMSIVVAGLRVARHYGIRIPRGLTSGILLYSVLHCSLLALALGTGNEFASLGIGSVLASLLFRGWLVIEGREWVACSRAPLTAR